ncbi:MAG: hypothetical protein ACRDJW_14405 [Thermomicrobiales bacterium]
MAQQGKPMTVLINPETDERLLREQWDRAWAAVDRIRERNKDKDPDEVLRDVTESVEEVRQERYEHEQRAAARGR